MASKASGWDFLDAVVRPGSPIYDRTFSLVGQYFATYTGRMFEVVGRDTGTLDPDRLLCEDIVATSMLSVTVPPRAAIEILITREHEIRSLLRDVPTNVPLSDAPDVTLGRDSPLWRLWDLLVGLPGVGPTTASKLLAHKRSSLVPIQDSYVMLHLAADVAARPVHTDARVAGSFWHYLRAWLQTEGTLDALEQLRADALRNANTTASRLLAEVSALRLLDVAMWTAVEAERQSAPTMAVD